MDKQVSKKIKDNIDTGLWFENEYGITASAFWDLGGWEDGGEYILNLHKGEMPAHASSRLKSLEALEEAMRWFEPDLRKWCYRD